MSADPDSALRAKCVSCGKWMLVRAGNPRCAECAKAPCNIPKPVVKSDIENDPHDEEQCSYCGAYVYLDSARCPKCGEYTDGLGKFNRIDQAIDRPRRLPMIFIVGGWLVLISMLLPIILAMYYYFLKR